MVVELLKYFPLFFMTLICTFCVVGFTIISSSEPAVLSSEHYFVSSINGIEPHAISITAENNLTSLSCGAFGLP